MTVTAGLRKDTAVCLEPEAKGHRPAWAGTCPRAGFGGRGVRDRGSRTPARPAWGLGSGHLLLLLEPCVAGMAGGRRGDLACS